MYKIAFNNSCSKFSISLKAIDWLEANCNDNELREFIKATRDIVQPSTFCNKVSDWFNDKRHHKDLIAVIEALGEDANGSNASLSIANINNPQYYIDDCNGYEGVITLNDLPWNFIEN